MRHLYLFFLFFNSLVFSQKMLESQGWCGKKYCLTMAGMAGMSDGRSDTIDILHTEIYLNLLAAPQISATAELQFVALQSAESVRFDLQGLTVDSVRSTSGALLPYSQQDASLFVYLPLAAGQQESVKVYYRGIPPTDVSGWGGFYHTGGYTFNLGVGFAADPHSFGRAWFPCFDNFVERCSFRTTVLTPDGKPAYANGRLVGEQTMPGGIERTWEIEDPIPSYLACFAAGPYTSFKRSYPGALGNIPVEIAASPADTNKVKATFQNLPRAIEVYEDWFGPYIWDKIGFSLVPFNSGAMEHATNVAIGRGYIDGSLNYETLWAHELSHHWWGDLATCSTAEDMWLNEGWASYCEHLFTEKVYGQTAFRKAVRDNHLSVLQNAHVAEGGYRAVSGVPHNLTYGTHVYNKGASVAHNLRGYLGDSLFRLGCRSALADTRFEDWSSNSFRDKLEAATGKDLHDFFENWVFSGGYPDYSVDSVKYFFSPVDAPTVVRVFVKQKRRGAPHFHQNVPLEFTFLMLDGQVQHHTVIVSGENSVVDFLFSAWGLYPMKVFVNANQKILQARAEGEKWLKITGTHYFPEAKWAMSVNSLGGADSIFCRVEHHFAAPDDAGANPNGYKLSNRYWSLYLTRTYSQSLADFDAQAILNYDGRGQLDQLDTELFDASSSSEDSVLLLYRPGPGHPWKEFPTYTKLTLGSTTDRWGQLRPTKLVQGEYTIGKGVSTLSQSNPQSLGKVSLSPNPADGFVWVKSEEPFHTATLVGADGRTEKTWHSSPNQEIRLNLEDQSSGLYWLLLEGARGTTVLPFVKKR